MVADDEETRQCSVCRLRTDAGQMLVCSSCEGASHLYQPRETKAGVSVIASTSSVAEAESEDLNQNRQGARRARNCIDSSTEEEETPEQRRPVTVRPTRPSISGGNFLLKRIGEDSQKLNISRFQILVRDLLRHKDCWPFETAVTKEEVPDYHQIISHPMDFGKIR